VLSRTGQGAQSSDDPLLGPFDSEVFPGPEFDRYTQSPPLKDVGTGDPPGRQSAWRRLERTVVSCHAASVISKPSSRRASCEI
jgi:hypothetical protein